MRVQELSTALLLLALGLSPFASCSTSTAVAVAAPNDTMITEERRVLKLKTKKSKTGKPTNQPTGSAAPTVSAAPVTTKAAKKKAAKSKKTTSTAPSPVPGPTTAAPSSAPICAACVGCYTTGTGICFNVATQLQCQSPCAQDQSISGLACYCD